MDTLDFIREKVTRLETLLPDNGLSPVIRHIEMAENHFHRGREEGDTDLFTDVVYRTNHAFEGILKEAYAVLEGKDPRKKTPYQIENYLAENDVFRPRVLDLFSQYRTEWRNPSTHDYILSFTEQEAFLSILSVTSFVSILLDQILEKAAFEAEKARGEGGVRPSSSEVEELESMPLVDRIAHRLSWFGTQLREDAKDPSEAELFGMIRAYLNTEMPDLVIETEPAYEDDFGRLRPDFILSTDKERLVLEVARYKHLTSQFERQRTDQVRRYIRASNSAHGIIFMYPASGARIPSEKYDKIIADASEPDHLIMRVRIRPEQTD
jgi:hypothetical protein